jgi:hypothetical protein
MCNAFSLVHIPFELEIPLLSSPISKQFSEQTDRIFGDHYWATKMARTPSGECCLAWARKPCSNCQGSTSHLTIVDNMQEDPSVPEIVLQF